MSELEWVKCCEKYGLLFEHSEITGDGLDRDGIVWLSCVVRKELLCSPLDHLAKINKKKIYIQ